MGEMKRNSVSILKTLIIIITINVLSFTFYSQRSLFLQSLEKDIFFHESLQFYSYSNVTNNENTVTGDRKVVPKLSHAVDFASSQD